MNATNSLPVPLDGPDGEENAKKLKRQARRVKPGDPLPTVESGGVAMTFTNPDCLQKVLQQPEEEKPKCLTV